MSSESLGSLCVALASIGTFFVTLTLGSAALVVRSYGDARASAQFAANDVVVNAQMMLARLPQRLFRLMKSGVFDEDSVWALASGWSISRFDDAEVATASGASTSFRSAMQALRADRRIVRDALVRGTEITLEEKEHAQDTLDWEAEWLPLTQLIATAELRVQLMIPLAEAAARLRDKSEWIGRVAALVSLELLVALATRISIVGPGEALPFNALVGSTFVILNILVLVRGSREVERLVRILTA